MVLLGGLLFVLFLHFVNQYFLRDIHLNTIGGVFFNLIFSFSLLFWRMTLLKCMGSNLSSKVDCISYLNFLSKAVA